VNPNDFITEKSNDVAQALPDGRDTLVGGPGIDTVSYEYREEGLTISLDGEPNDGADGEMDNVGADIENVIGGLRSDRIVGNDLDNSLRGGTLSYQDPVGNAPDHCWPAPDIHGIGSDTIEGGAGNDTISANDGISFLFGGDGDDQFYAWHEGLGDSIDGGAGDDSAQIDEPQPEVNPAVDQYSNVEHVELIPPPYCCPI
jgi:Ca2+-binding RTX toxin-like protein